MRTWRTIILLAALCFTACESPVETRLRYRHQTGPSVFNSLSADSLLSGYIAVRGDTLDVLLLSSVRNRTIAQFCSACPQPGGAAAQWPGFNAQIVDSLVLPPGITSLTISGGRVETSWRNRMQFDPLRPPGAVTQGGYSVVMSSAGRVSVSRGLQSFTPNTLWQTAYPVQAGELIEPLIFTTTIVSPSGGFLPAHRVNVNAGLFEMHAIPVLQATAARVALKSRNFTFAGLRLDLRQADAEAAATVTEGGFIAMIDNPWQFNGSLSFTIRHGTNSVMHAVPLTQGAATYYVPLDPADLAWMLGHVLDISVVATVSSLDAGTRVTPREKMGFTLTLDYFTRTPE